MLSHYTKNYRILKRQTELKRGAQHTNNEKRKQLSLFTEEET